MHNLKPDVLYEPAGWKYFSIVEEVKDFVKVVQSNDTPAVDPLDCCYGLRVIHKAYESTQSGTTLTVPD